MPETQVRPFARADRDQLATLVNAHISAVVPGVSVSVQALLSHLERDPGEFVVDPWVTQRLTLVAEQRSRVVAAAHLLRYGDDERVGRQFRDTAEIRWLVCWPAAPYWPDAPAAGAALMEACLRTFGSWEVRGTFADGSLPAPGVFGVPEQWPHVAGLYARAGFAGSRRETVLIAATDRLAQGLPRPDLPLQLRRTLGINGTRFSAWDGDVVLGYLEIDTNLGEAGRFSRGWGWADVGNLHIEESARRQGVATWLLAHAVDWLELGGIGRMLTYLGEEDGPPEAAFWASAGFATLTTTTRLWQRG
jgi:GNAT superfamily N-acetyltransferase